MGRLNKEIWGWALYDWANSAFAVSILAVIFQFYFVDVLATSGTELIKEVTIFGTTIPSASLWSWSVSLSMIFVVIICPIVGAIADYTGKKKLFLFFFCYTGAGTTMLMVFLKVGMWQLGMLLFILSNICFVGGNVVYNGMLIDVAPSEDDIGFVSGFGWGLGYMASFLMLTFNLILINLKIPSPEWAVRISLLSVGIWWAVFAIPTFLWVKERSEPKDLPEDQTLLTVGFSRIKKTVKSLPRYPEMLLFMGAFFLYNDGVQTVISQSATFTNYALGATLESIIPAFVMIQIVAFFGSFIFIRIEKGIGAKRALVYSLMGWILIIGWALVMHKLAEFYVMAFIGGLILGVSQSASRTIYALMIPHGHSAEFFSLYAIVGKIASLVGPFLFGAGALYAARLETIPIINSMAGAILPLLLMVIIGTLLLIKVDVAKGREEAKAGFLND
ncbi:MAG: MFS transporter [Desulfobacterales bacterium]|nr:MFS transporter [Desulfobacterales bacterium]